MVSSDKMTVAFLLTHENPDLDAMTSVLLMRRFGEDKFPGVSKATVLFCPADKLPENKTPQQLEQEGILAVDIGGGRFDAHPVNNKISALKKERSATDIIADALGVTVLTEWQPLIEFIRLHDTQGHSSYSREYIHNLTSLSTIVQGIDIINADKSNEKLETGIGLIETIPYYVQFKKNINARIGDIQKNEIELLQQFLERYISAKQTEYSSSPKYKNIAKWIDILNSDPSKAFSNNTLDVITSLVAIVNGAFYKENNNLYKAYDVFEICMEAILAREEKWLEALDDFNANALIKRIGKIDIVSIESNNAMSIKVARHLTHGDIIIFRNAKDGATTIFIKRNGMLHNFQFKKIVSKVRLVESYLNNEKPLFDKIDALGEVHGWFLHQSDCLLIKGSPKARDFIPSKINLKLLSDIICYVFDSNTDYDIPEKCLSLFLTNDNPLFRKKIN